MRSQLKCAREATQRQQARYHDAIRQLPAPLYTAAQAYAAAEAMRAELPPAARQQLDEAERFARSHPLIDVLDAFCNGIQLAAPLPPVPKAGVIAHMHADVMAEAFRRW